MHFLINAKNKGETQMKLEELLINKMSKKQVLELFIDGVIDGNRNLISEHTFENKIDPSIFHNTFTAEGVEEMFKVDTSLPSLLEILEGEKRIELVDGTGFKEKRWNQKTITLLKWVEIINPLLQQLIKNIE